MRGAGRRGAGVRRRMPETPKFDILGIGAVAVDDVIHVGGYPPPMRPRACQSPAQPRFSSGRSRYDSRSSVSISSGGTKR